MDWYLQLGKSTNRLGNIFVTGIHTNNLWYDSDEEWKKEIAPITSSLEILQSLNGKTYKFKDSHFEKMPEYEKQFYTQTQFGFIAEEMQRVLPSLVYTDSGTTNSRINYIAIIPILVEAIKEQQATIEQLVANEYSTGFVDNRSSKVSNKAELFQNVPNPYTDKTEIKFSIPSGGLNPLLIISNLNGEQIKKYNITGRGAQTIVIDGGDLVAGSYYYTLILDNKEVATKKMILVK